MRRKKDGACRPFTSLFISTAFQLYFNLHFNLHFKFFFDPLQLKRPPQAIPVFLRDRHHPHTRV